MFGTPSGAHVFYEVRGQGRTFVMFHGSPSDHARAMSHLEPAFERRSGWRRIYPDLPGHGKSPGTSTIRDMDDYLRVLLEFIDDVSGQGRFCIGGISFGAYFALAVARKRKNRVGGLLLSVPQINHDPLEERRERTFRNRSVPNPQRDDPELREYREETGWLEGLPFQDVSVDLYRNRVPIQIPALFLFGRQDAPFRSRKYWSMLDRFPRATFAVLDGAGHRLWTDRNDLACTLVRDWLDRVEEAERDV